MTIRCVAEMQVLRPALPLPANGTIAWGGDALELSMRHPLLPRAALDNLFAARPE